MENLFNKKTEQDSELKKSNTIIRFFIIASISLILIVIWFLSLKDKTVSMEKGQIKIENPIETKKIDKINDEKLISNGDYPIKYLITVKWENKDNKYFVTSYNVTNNNCISFYNLELQQEELFCNDKLTILISDLEKEINNINN